MNHLLIVLAALVFTIFPTCGAETDMGAAATEILNVSDWTRSEAVELANKRIGEKRGREILVVMEKFRNISPEEARQLVINLSNSGKPYDLSIGGKIYIFNRVYCNVPEVVKKVDWKFFGAWGSVPQDENTVNALYPLRLTAKGKLEIFYLSGSYAGPVYRGLDEFDFLLKRFGKRKAVNR